MLAPSQAELRHIGSDPEKLRDYTRAAMEQYAANFGKGIEGRDLVYFAKVEHERTTGPADRAVQVGEVARGQAKSGDQTHIHVLVSRTENLAQIQQRAQKIGRAGPQKPVPLKPAHPTTRTRSGGGNGRV